MEEQGGREQWGSRIGFILAAIGSAVGLGNIWRFPYLTAKSGGASFVLLYIILLFIIGMPVMVAEFIIGRGGQKSPVQSMAQEDEPNWSVLGLLFVFTGFWILSYYSVVAGWAMKYTIDSITMNLMQVNPPEFFGQISSGTTALFYHFLFMAITTVIVTMGVKKGIESCVKVLIPLLFVMIIGLGVWAFTQPGSAGGYSFYLEPDFSKMIATYYVAGIPITFLNLNLLANAAGQTFFTLSLGMGAMITYASYLSKDEDLAEETTIIALSNFGIAFLSGLMVFPIISAFNLFDSIKESTVATLFMAVPKAFQEIGGIMGGMLSAVFFTCLFLAALTSAISLLEVVTSASIDQLPINRRGATVMNGTLIFVFGVLPASNTDILSLMDTMATNLLLMSGGLLLAIYVGWLMKSATEEFRKGLKFDLVVPWKLLIRFVIPPVLLALLIQGVYTLFTTLAK
ncbi:MAG: sodium-dependent transporter [bacterium]